MDDQTSTDGLVEIKLESSTIQAVNQCETKQEEFVTVD